MTSRDDPADLQLQVIARCLGLPVEAFSDPAIAARVGQRDELLRLWESLASEEARQAVLNLVRAIVKAQQG